MIFADTLTLDRSAIRYRPSDGAAIAEVPVARTGIQDYAGWEVGRPELQRVSVYRPPETVFDDAYIASMAHRPITDDHPPEAVDASNWRKYSHGHTGETIRKDEANGLVYVPMMISDQALIEKLKNGKREVSCGYSCDLVWEDGVTPEGARYQAKQVNATINHVAVVKHGRAGSMCRIGDSWAEFNDKEPLVAVRTITYDGLPVEVTDAAEAVINKLTAARDSLKSELDTANREVGTLTADKATLEGRVTALEASLADAKVTPEKLAKLVADRAALVEDAKKIASDLVADGLDDDGIRLAAVKAKLGDKAPTDPARVAGAFDALLAQVSATDGFRETVKNGTVANDTIDVEADRAARKAALSNAWKGAN